MINSLGNNRYINVPKHELVNGCFSSLVDSINQVKDHNIRLIVLDDHSAPEAVEDFKKIISCCQFPSEFISVEDGTGNGHTMRRVYEQVEKHATDLWYHVEDDYLHCPEAIQDMLDTVNQLEVDTHGKMVAIFPHDDIFRYRGYVTPSIAVLGPYRHYKTVTCSTYTCLASRATYDKYRQHFQDVVLLTEHGFGNVEELSINKVWTNSEVLLFNPIPGLAFHITDPMHKDPYFDIMKLWNSVPKLWLNN
jgi:hypothetical protein